MEELLKQMGYGFRDLTYHSNGKWSCRLGFSFTRHIKGNHEYWGDTPQEALLLAKEALDTLDLRSYFLTTE